MWGLSRKVVTLARDNMSDTATWIIHVAEIARDDVDVDMRNRLPRGGARIEADIVAVRLWIEAEV
jgi:hypothetical protein